ncbi:MAG: selenocysteine synthase (seryl-tRNASer selenium transferase)-like protein [Candidatus Solibacter sp.]|nr:selenocysteine synthase (seryl-tRNASer selenium transferase)-like protein [Candidatus Solibacter sp.]
MQDSLASRRGFLSWGNRAVAAAGLASRPLVAASSRQDNEGEDYYEKLGVAKIINAAGTYTALTASTMPPSVRAAVARAAKHPVRLAELQTAAGVYLARQLRCEAAMVTSGAASSLTLGTAACMSVANRAAVHKIPTDLEGLKTEVIVQKAHRYDYDHAMRNCGARFVEVETLAEYEAAFNDRTVMTNYFNAAEAGQIGREDWIRVAHSHNVPCFNDAAADVPPISNLWNYTKMGFDLVAFSGGKGMRGPQNAGLLLGRKDLIAAAVLNSSPRSDTVGRGMKVAKEQIVGMVAAVDWFLSQTDAGMEADFRKRAERIAAQLKTVPTLEAKIVIPNVAANVVPHLLLRYDQGRVKISPLDVAAELRRGTPSIELHPGTGHKPAAGLPTDESTIVVGVWMLEPGEEAIVARRLREVLTKAVA